jgi:iron complex outermembrane receptor protein
VQQPQARVGRVIGVVRDSAGQPIANAQVQLVGTRLGTMTGSDGRFRIGNVPVGTYDVRVQRIGEQPKVVSGVAVQPNGEAAMEVALERAAVKLGGVVVTASRRAEKVTDAPATVTSIGPQVLDNMVGNTFAAALKEAKGIDFIQVGMTAIAINARGFNSSFNNRFLMVEDGRISVLPENGLPVGQFTITPKVDLAGMEVLVGPGSALYGPDASSGVLSLRTKDPREFQGATLELTAATGATRTCRRATPACAATWATRSRRVQTANDWSNYLFYNSNGGVVDPRTATPQVLAAAVREDTLRGGNGVDWNARVARGERRRGVLPGAESPRGERRFSRTDGVGQTNVGRNQLSGWLYNVQQARFTTPHWYFNAYRAQSRSGDSYALNRYAGAQLAPANRTLTADSLRMLSDWPSDGRMYAAEIQGNYAIAPLLNTSVVFGAQYRNDVVSSNRQWLTDRNTGRTSPTRSAASTRRPRRRSGAGSTSCSPAGSTTPTSSTAVEPEGGRRREADDRPGAPRHVQPRLQVADDPPDRLLHPRLDGGDRDLGNTGGFRTVNAAGSEVARYGAVRPESNRTWEYGYKGIIKDRLFVDATYFSSKYENFLSPLTIVGNPLAGANATFAVPIENPGNRIP